MDFTVGWFALEFNAGSGDFKRETDGYSRWFVDGAGVGLVPGDVSPV
ncbi:MAG: hypothetical protein ACI8PT_004424 [Gammaproteobacteria bacterium]|jgi:hypothetical protein